MVKLDRIDWPLVAGMSGLIVFVVASVLMVTKVITVEGYFAMLSPVFMWLAYHAGAGWSR